MLAPSVDNGLAIDVGNKGHQAFALEGPFARRTNAFDGLLRSAWLAPEANGRHRDHVG